MVTLAESPRLSVRGKRHFSEEMKRPSVGDTSPLFPRRRRYIPHGHCEYDDLSWRPHATAIEPQYTECGPDWSSRLRTIPYPHDMNRRSEDLWPECSTKLRTFPGANSCSVFEWSFYTNGYNTGKRCFFDTLHKRSAHGLDEITHKSSMGYKRREHMIDKRNGIYSAAEGDNLYQAAEYEPGFFKNGATVAPTNFGEHYVKESDTFIPLTPLPAIPPIPYKKKEAYQKYRETVEEVVDLDKWKPATPIQLTLKPNMFLTTSKGKREK